MKTWPALDIQFPDAAATPADADPEAGALDLPDRLQATLADFPVTAIHEGSPDASRARWRVFFATAPSRDAARTVLTGTHTSSGLVVISLDVDDEDWAARSQASIHAIRIGNIVVAPPWDVPSEGRLKPAQTDEAPQPDALILIIIEPSMGFGTGHHATTRLCLDALQQIDLRGAHVLDVGTGSGVLAIAATRLGASRVLGIDDDVDAIESARQNLTLNPGVDITLGVVDLRYASLRPIDVVVGNLTGALLISSAAALKALSHGRLILSGFMEQEAPDVLAAFDGWTVERRAQEDEWVCVTLSWTGTGPGA